MRKKKHAGGHENAERWLLTYADMITLLVAFFIMLYAMSVVSKAKFTQLALSVRSGFDGNTKMQAIALSAGHGIAMSDALISPQKISEVDFRPQAAKRSAEDTAEQQNMDRIKSIVEKIAREHHVSNLVQVHETDRGLVIRILTDKLLFLSGDAHLQPQYTWLLDVLANAVKDVPNNIAVEGHTDSLPIHNAEYPSNWELSTSRATTVLRYLTEHDGLPPNRFSASGYADTRPLYLNDNDLDRSRNRRVDIVVLRNAVETDAQWTHI